MAQKGYNQGAFPTRCAAMDEQRVQAYLSLIQELFTCPRGEENNVLNQSSELVDEGFLQVCEQGEA